MLGVLIQLLRLRNGLVYGFCAMLNGSLEHDLFACLHYGSRMCDYGPSQERTWGIAVGLRFKV